MNKWFKGIFWLFITLLLAPFFFEFVDMFVNTTDGIMVVGDYAAYCPDYLVAFVGALPWLLPLAVIISVIIMWARPDKPKLPDNFQGF